MIKTVGFDLGETLVEYEGVPLNWQQESASGPSLAQDRCCAVMGSAHTITELSELLALVDGRHREI